MRARRFVGADAAVAAFAPAAPIEFERFRDDVDAILE
jgi:hypothetical protein